MEDLLTLGPGSAYRPVPAHGGETAQALLGTWLAETMAWMCGLHTRSEERRVGKECKA